VRSAKRFSERESKPSVLDHPSLLRRATYVALIKVAAFRISLVLRITEFAFRALQMEGLKGGHRFQRSALSLALGLVSVAKFYYFDDNYELNSNLYRPFQGVCWALSL
jgi:hypothetical protein